MAAAVVSVAHKQHINVPEQISVVGFDDTELASTIWPSITTIKQPLTDMASLAISLLTESENNSSDIDFTIKRHVLPYQLCLRESSKRL